MKSRGWKLFILFAGSLLITGCLFSGNADNGSFNPFDTTPVARLPLDSLIQKGKLLICTDISYPPQEFFDDDHHPSGSDVEIGDEIAYRLGLESQYVDTEFDSLIDSLHDGKCDLIISGQNITSARQKLVSMIPYFKAGVSIMVTKSNPNKIRQPLDICGLSVAVESKTMAYDTLGGTGEYRDRGLTQNCIQSGKKAPNILTTQTDSDALEMLQDNRAAAFMTDEPYAVFYTNKHSEKFKIAGKPLFSKNEGISVVCETDDCTQAPLTPLGNAVQKALNSMVADGTYANILDKWNLNDSDVTDTEEDRVVSRMTRFGE